MKKIILVVFVLVLYISLVAAEDADNDGVDDINDLCPDTEEGQVVDENGCSCAQKDCDDNNPFINVAIKVP